MPDTETLPQRASDSPPIAPVSRRRRRGRFSPVWIIPLVSAVLGLWLVWRHYSAKGPEVTVRFETAEGIIAGKTPVLCRSVNIGTVSMVELTNDIKGVIVTLDMNRDATRLLVDDTQIWVVRARYSSAGISGLNTLVSGNYIELQPGVSKKARRHFTGLENPPPTPPGVPGAHIKLIAEQAGGLGPGASIVFKGISVGKLETRVFHPETGDVEFTAFIEGQYARLISGQTRFYNSGGLDLKVGAEGVSLRTGTLESLLSSSVTFTEPESKNLAAHPIADGHTFILYSNLDEAKKADFNPTLPYLLLFTKSVRGLSPEAPVEFRGIRVGSVIGASFKYLPDDPEHRVPVLIKIDPAALLADRPNHDPAAARAFLAQSVDNGLRATLKTGSLLTGQLFVELDFQKDAPPATIASISSYDVLPTVPASGLDELQEKVGALLDKFKALPVEQTVDDANQALVAVKGAAGNLDKLSGELVNNNDVGAILHNLRLTSQQLKTISENLTEATDTVKHQPWRLIWPSTKTYEESQSPPPRPTPTTSPRKTSRNR
jgi:paraquat-inducible protein B